MMSAARLAISSSRERDLNREIASWVRRYTCLPTAYTHLSAAESAAAQTAPCSPKRRHLRAKHAHDERSTPSHLQFARDRDLNREIASWVRRYTCLPTAYTAHLSAVESATAQPAPCSPKRRHLRAPSTPMMSAACA